MEVKTPPNDIEAEKSILGMMLVDADAVMEATEKLTSDHFYMPVHQIIYSAMLDLHAASEPVDIITVQNILKKNNQIDTIGGWDYLSALAESTIITTNIVKYIDIIVEKYKLREIIKTGTKITELGHGEEDPTAIIDLVEKEVFDLAKDESKDSYQRLDTILTKAFLEIEEMNESDGGLIGVPSGLIDLDSKTAGFKGSNLIIIAARPGMGKSALAVNVATYAAKKANTPALIFNMEMSKTELAKRILSSEAMVNNYNISTGKMTENELVKLNAAASELSKVEIYIDDTPGINIMEIRAKSRRLKLEKNIGIIVIDYLQLIEPLSKRNTTREQEISEISRSLKKLAMELDVPILALSQLSRSAEKGEKGARPKLSDLRESGAIEQDADMVMFIYRDDYYNKDSETPNTAEIILAKNRGGSIGTVETIWMGEYTKFLNAADEKDIGDDDRYE